MTTTAYKKEPFFRRLASSFRRLDTVTKVFLVAFLVLGIATGVVAFTYVRAFVERAPSFTVAGLALGGDSGDQADNGEDAPAAPASSNNVYSYTQSAAWDGTSRVTVLVMGLDARDWEAGAGAPRTDSMILLTFDPITKTAGILSVPRDLWVEIPGFGHDKINNAYALGEGNRLPGGGPGMAVETIEQLLGITINYYAQIDFGAFVDFIDIIGGVKINIPTDTRVEVIGDTRTNCPSGGCTLIPSGKQVLTGELALAYARARHSGDGDFDRSRRQQEVILAVRQQLARDDVRALVLNNLLSIYERLSSGINTNMALDEAVSLAWAVKDINLDNIQRGILAPGACTASACIGPDYVIPDKSPEGLDILKPVSQNIRVLRDQIFSSGSVRSPLANTSQSADLMKMEASQVAIYNGSGNGGLADSTRAYLEAQGMLVASTNNADSVGATTIYDYTGNPYTVQYLVNLMGIQPSRIFSSYDPNNAVDVEVILGPDWSVPAQ